MASDARPKPPFTLRQLQYFAAVAETGSFRQAAARCFVAQPSLSAQLAALEQALGVRLLERGAGRAKPTKAGRVLLPRAQALLVAADDLRAAARDFVDPLAGELRIGVIPTVSPYLVPQVAPALARAFPRLTVRWQEDRTPTLVEALDAGRIDAALLALEAELGAVEHAAVGIDRFVLAAASGTPLANGARPLARADLAGAPLLLLEDGHCLRDQALGFCARARPEEVGFRATSLTTLVQMVAAGQGVTLLPELAVPIETQRARLALRRFAAPEPHRTIALVWRRHSPLAEALRAVAAELRAAYPDPGARPGRRREVSGSGSAPRRA
jgi:LysR family hydrogen peroxide-inducible transcriptional activator